MDQSMAEEELFVSNEFVEDPVVSETPVYLNSQAGDRLVLLQYPTRKAPSHNRTRAVRLKPSSQVLETEVESQIPSVYINSARGSAGLGLNQTFSGVLNKNDGHFALAYASNGAVHFSLVPRSGQLRPKFEPPASPPAAASQQAQPQAQQQPGAAGLRSVQMSVKSSTSEQPKHTGVLEFWRQANKENFEDYDTGEVDDATRAAVLSAKNQENIDLGIDIGAELSFL